MLGSTLASDTFVVELSFNACKFRFPIHPFQPPWPGQLLLWVQVFGKRGFVVAPKSVHGKHQQQEKPSKTPLKCLGRLLLFLAIEWKETQKVFRLASSVSLFQIK